MGLLYLHEFQQPIGRYRRGHGVAGRRALGSSILDSLFLPMTQFTQASRTSAQADPIKAQRDVILAQTAQLQAQQAGDAATAARYDRARQGITDALTALHDTTDRIAHQNMAVSDLYARQPYLDPSYDQQSTAYKNAMVKIMGDVAQQTNAMGGATIDQLETQVLALQNAKWALDEIGNELGVLVSQATDEADAITARQRAQADAIARAQAQAAADQAAAQQKAQADALAQARAATQAAIERAAQVRQIRQQLQQEQSDLEQQQLLLQVLRGSSS